MRSAFEPRYAFIRTPFLRALNKKCNFFTFFQCTKNKTWKDIAAQLGIGASSSGAYTLKKHYGKNLLAFECQFDRGGMDPGPLLAQVEAQSKKKAKASMPEPPPAPSPGSQDSRDSYSNSSDPYSGGYPAGTGPPPMHNSYPPSRSAPTPDMNNSNSDRPPSHPGQFVLLFCTFLKGAFINDVTQLGGFVNV